MSAARERDVINMIAHLRGPIDMIGPLYSDELLDAADMLESLAAHNRALEDDIAIYAEDCEKAERLIEEHNKRCERECGWPDACHEICNECPRQYMIEVPK